MLWVCHEWARERAYVSVLELSVQSFVCCIGLAPRIKGNSVVPELGFFFFFSSPSPPQPPFLSLICLGCKSASRILWVLFCFLSSFLVKRARGLSCDFSSGANQAPHTCGNSSPKEMGNSKVHVLGNSGCGSRGSAIEKWGSLHLVICWETPPTPAPRCWVLPGFERTKETQTLLNIAFCR